MKLHSGGRLNIQCGPRVLHCVLGSSVEANDDIPDEGVVHRVHICTGQRGLHAMLPLLLLPSSGHCSLDASEAL